MIDENMLKLLVLGKSVGNENFGGSVKPYDYLRSKAGA